MDAEQLAVQVPGCNLCEPGEMFMIEVHGADRTVVIKAKVSMASEGIIAFTFSAEPLSLPPREKARIKVEGIGATLTSSNGAIDVEVSDISIEGCGLLSSVQVEKSSLVELLVDSPAGPIDCRGEVRYCKNDSEMPGLYRIGLLLQPLGRLEQARWNKMIEYSLEAA